MPKITRVGVTFPPDLLKDFDSIIDKMGYESRSKAIQDAVRHYVSERNGFKKKQTPNKPACY
jgi:metal-responsive CopG/Arc/MetJ family transcriptional regulator